MVPCKRAVSLAVVAFAVAACGQQPTPTEPNGPRPTTAGKIAFTRGIPSNIYVMNADGTGQSKLTEGEDPAWSPDGTHIVFARTAAPAPASASGPTPPSSPQIWVMNGDGSGQVKLTESSGGDDSPTWSPTGDKIAFASVGHTRFPGKIYVMNADGSNPTQVTFSDFADFSPTWSSDGKRIAFARFPLTAGEPSGTGQIYVINSDDTGLTKLGGKLDTLSSKSLSWSPDGRKIAFEGDDRLCECGAIFVMNADGTGQTKLTSGRRGGDGSPTWSPDGTAVAFESNRNSAGIYALGLDIYVINSNGTGVARLTTFDDASQPAWSPVLPKG